MWRPPGEIWACLVEHLWYADGISPVTGVATACVRSHTPRGIYGQRRPLAWKPSASNPAFSGTQS